MPVTTRADEAGPPGSLRTLFVTWDGPDQSYLESLYLPIFERIARRDPRFCFDVLQITSAASAATQKAQRAAEARAMTYVDHGILRPSTNMGTALTIGTAAGRLLDLSRRKGTRLVLARSVIPAAVVLLSRALQSRLPWAFDADGFMTEERRELAGWSATSLPYRVLRDVELQGLWRSDAVLTRTRAARELLRARAGSGLPADKIHVVPNGSDERIFRPRSAAERAAVRARFQLGPDAPWWIALGSAGPQYCVDESLSLFRKLRDRRPEAVLSFFTGNAEYVQARMAAAGISEGVQVTRLDPSAVAEVLAAADLGLALRRPSFSQRAVSPIKVAEYLLSGLPVLAHRATGDLAEDLDGCEAVRLIEGFDSDDFDGACRWFVDDVVPRRPEHAQAARARALELYTVSRAAEGYRRALLAAAGSTIRSGGSGR